ncbi:hypothetical protein EC973_008923 [Apophysomyces ossiformis]|uniref:DASH complex subunit DUO1 n=1 Tax=Apophysomyces ossiformis TaxID=679940 RepID=A0A8H7ENU0_9FUNG|nr:hypothetical protein EC973_008923 [Apophysomyces ossiformis]
MAQDQDRWMAQNALRSTHDEAANYINASRSSMLLSNRRTTMLFRDHTQPPVENPNNSPEVNAQRRHELETVQNLNHAIEASIQHAEQATEKIKQLAQTVDQTDKLLDLWTQILSQTEHTKRLLEDPNWQGVDHDNMLAQKEEQVPKNENKEEVKGRLKNNTSLYKRQKR